MASRGRGRGGRGGGRGNFPMSRGWGGGGQGGGSFYNNAKPVSHENFPEINLPSVPKADDMTNEEKMLIRSAMKLEEFWRGSCYYLQQNIWKTKNDEDVEIERYSERKRKPQAKREALASYLKLIPTNFPAELIEGSRQGQQSKKKRRWDRDSGDQFDGVFSKHEEKEAKGEEPKKTENGEKEDGEDEEEKEEYVSSDESDDYMQNIDFDDDEDDMNMDEKEQEDYYD